ncbi:hypothetical protein AKJ16_DCAP11092, partial [Drosera capensis]
SLVQGMPVWMFMTYTESMETSCMYRIAMIKYRCELLPHFFRIPLVNVAGMDHESCSAA